MTPPQSSSVELARRDIEHIKTLQKTEAFSNFFLRRMREKRDRMNERFHEDPAAKCDAMQREAYRQVIAAYDELLGLMESEEAQCKQTLQSAPAEPR